MAIILIASTRTVQEDALQEGKINTSKPYLNQIIVETANYQEISIARIWLPQFKAMETQLTSLVHRDNPN